MAHQVLDSTILGSTIDIFRGPVHVDSDLAEDDFMALGALVAAKANIIGITFTGCGIARLAPARRNIFRFLKETNMLHVPFAGGNALPLQGDHKFPENWRNQADQFYGLKESLHVEEESEIKDGEELLAHNLRTSMEKVRIIALGPMTNIAKVLRSHPELADRIEHIYVMGGAFHPVQGNIQPCGVPIDNDVAEWNIYIDPLAAREVLEKVSPRITFVPLNATDKVVLDAPYFHRLEQYHPTAVSDLIYRMLNDEELLGKIIYRGFLCFWDPLTAVIAMNDSFVTSWEDTKVDIVTEEGKHSGQTIYSTNGCRARVVTDVAVERFKECYFTTLTS